MALLNSLDKLGDKSNGGKAGKTMSEVYQYYSGARAVFGQQQGQDGLHEQRARATTAASNASSTRCPATRSVRSPARPYSSPIMSGSCAGNYVIYISNGAVQDNTSDNNTATNQLATAAAAEGITGATTAIAISPSGSQSNVADEWARFMQKSSKNITTYTMDVDKVTTGQGARLVQRCSRAWRT